MKHNHELDIVRNTYVRLKSNRVLYTVDMNVMEMRLKVLEVE